MTAYVTLAQAAMVSDIEDIDRTVIQDFVKNDYLLANLPFHQAAARTGMGSAYTYTYTRETTQPDAAFRALNSDYTPSAAEVEQFTVACKILGGSFEIDRVLGEVSPEEIAHQLSVKVRGARAVFSDAVINGDSSGLGSNAFDGLSVALDGTDTEVDASDWDWSVIADASDALAILGQVDELVDSVVGDNKVIIANRKTLAKINTAAIMTGYRTASEDAAGRKVREWNGVPFVDLGEKAGSSDAIVGVTDGATDLYVVSLSADGFHAVSPAGRPLVKTYLPTFTNAGSAKDTGAVEMVATVALKRTRAAAVARGLAIAAPAPVGG